MSDSTNPLVSVVIPTWNRREILPRALESVLGQSYGNLEILVCDDGSTDGTEEYVKSLDDKRIRYLPGERGGRPAIPRNRGIRKARGEFVAFLDSDDEWLPDKIETQLKVLYDRKTRAACSNALRIVPNSKKPAEKYVFWEKAYVKFEDLIAGNLVINSSALVGREILEKVGGFPERSSLAAIEDYALWLRIATFTDFAFSPEPLVKYFDNPSESVRGEPLKIFEVKRKVFEDFSIWAESSELSGEYTDKMKIKPKYLIKNYKSLIANALKILLRSAGK